MDWDWLKSPSRRLLILCLSVILGMAAHAWFEVVWLGNWFLILAAVALTLAIAARRRAITCLAAVVFLLLFLSWWRFDAAIVNLPAYREPPGSELDFTGVIASVSAQESSLSATGVRAAGEPLEFDVAVYSALDLRVLPGDSINWKCRPLGVADSALFMRTGVGWRCFVKEVAVSARGQPSLMRLLAMARLHLRDAISDILPETESALLLGLLAGERSGLPKDFSDAFRNSGTSHLLAVSGYQVSQLITFFLVALALKGMARRRAHVFSMLGVAIFTMFVGAGMSVVRAALMGSLLLAAGCVSRRYDSATAVSFAAAVMLLSQPLALRNDLGFQLSFVAVLGLQYLGPEFKGLPGLRRLPNFVAEPLATTLAATVATLPIILHAFGVLPVMTLFANVLAAPLVPISMLSGVLAAAAASVLPQAFGPWLGVVPWAPLKVLGTLVMAFGRVPTVPFAMSFLSVVVVYVTIISFICLRRRERAAEKFLD